MPPAPGLRWPVVLFDLDGTLADTIPLIVESYNHAFRTVLGVERDEAEILGWIGRPLLESFELAAPERAAELDAVYREWNLANTDRLIRRYDGVVELLGELAGAGARLGVVTSKRRQTAGLALAAVGAADLVPVLAAMEDTATHKPGPEPLLHACSLLEVPPSEVVYVGDAVVDVLAARAAGVAAVAVTWGAGVREALVATEPDSVADTVADLRVVLLPAGTP